MDTTHEYIVKDVDELKVTKLAGLLKVKPSILEAFLDWARRKAPNSSYLVVVLDVKTPCVSMSLDGPCASVNLFVESDFVRIIGHEPKIGAIHFDLMPLGGVRKHWCGSSNCYAAATLEYIADHGVELVRDEDLVTRLNELLDEMMQSAGANLWRSAVNLILRLLGGGNKPG